MFLTDLGISKICSRIVFEIRHHTFPPFYDVNQQSNPEIEVLCRSDVFGCDLLQYMIWHFENSLYNILLLYLPNQKYSQYTHQINDKIFLVHYSIIQEQGGHLGHMFDG